MLACLLAYNFIRVRKITAVTGLQFSQEEENDGGDKAAVLKLLSLVTQRTQPQREEGVFSEGKKPQVSGERKQE